jgi:hypothetical protein
MVLDPLFLADFAFLLQFTSVAEERRSRAYKGERDRVGRATGWVGKNK